MTTGPHLSVTTADIGFLVQQIPVSSSWMYPRPLFYLEPYSIGITVPKEMGGNTGLKTATPSSVFVRGHSGPDPLPATNIILLQQASGVKERKEAMKQFTVLGAISLMRKKPRNRSRFQLRRQPEVKGKVP